MPKMTATSEINKPTPENSATVTNCAVSEFSFSEVDETGIGVEMRAAFGMKELQNDSVVKKSPPIQESGEYVKGSIRLIVVAYEIGRCELLHTGRSLQCETN